MKKNKRHIIIAYSISACRFLLAAVFIFSGFVKAVDPRGFSYKIEEYLTHFRLDALVETTYVALLGAVLVSSVEFLIGIYLLFGIRKRLTAIVALLFMLVMTLLSLYIYLFDPVKDCGCFGDAVLLSNSATFFKNIVLLAAAVFLCYYRRRRVFRFVSERNQWLISIYSIFFILIFSISSLYYLPILDFRPYRVGVNLPALMEKARNVAYETEFILEKDGERRTFTIDNYPDSTWTFVDSHTKASAPAGLSDVNDFIISEPATGDDVTDALLSDTAYSFWLISPDLSSTHASVDAVNTIYDYCMDHNVRFYCITASDVEEIEEWKQYIGLQCYTYVADEKLLQTVVRSDPGLLLMKDGTILGKWSKNNYPDAEEVQTLMSGEETFFSGKSRGAQLLKILLWYVVPLLIITLADRLWIGYKFYRRYKYRKTHINQKKK